MVMYISICLHREICPGLQVDFMKIKRPLFIIALAMLVVIYMINTMPGSIFFACPALFCIFIIIHKFTKDRYTQHLVLFMLAAILAAGYLSFYNSNLRIKQAEMESAGNTVVTGTVVDENISTSSINYTIAINSFDNEKIHSFKVKVYTGHMLSAGDTVKMTGKYKNFTPKSNYIYNYSEGIYGYFYADEIEIIEDVRSIISFFMDVRTKLVDKSRKIFNYKSVPLAVAMGLGDKSLLDAATVNDFSFTGLRHALVVSGLHIGFIVAALNMLLYYIPVKKKLKNIVLSMFVLFFMGMIGFTPSIIRAGCLMIALLSGRNLFIEIDNYTVLALIIIITLIMNPYTAHSGSLLLSYSAYFGVIKRYEISTVKNYSEIISSLLATTFAMLYTCPVIALLGMYTTFASPLFNLLLSPVIMIVCVLSFFLPVLSYLPVAGGIICAIFAPVNDVLISLIKAVIPLGEKYFSFALVNLATDGIKILIFSAVIAVALAYIQFDSKRVRNIFVITVPLVAFLCYNYMNRDVVTVNVFDGSSEPSYIISYDDKNYLVATENINRTRFAQIYGDLQFDKFDEIIYCGKKSDDIGWYSDFTDNLVDLSAENTYENDLFGISVNIDSKRKAYIIDINDVKIGFNHNKTDMTDYNLDMYFFGSSTADDIQADNLFYFYPVIKKNADLANEKQATELYDILTIKIKLSTGRYSIVEDVKNFGSRI